MLVSVMIKTPALADDDHAQGKKPFQALEIRDLIDRRPIIIIIPYGCVWSSLFDVFIYPAHLCFLDSSHLEIVWGPVSATASDLKTKSLSSILIDRQLKNRDSLVLKHLFFWNFSYKYYIFEKVKNNVVQRGKVAVEIYLEHRTVFESKLQYESRLTT